MGTVVQKNWKEKWILYVGRKASWRYWPLVLIIFAIAPGLHFLVTKSTLSAVTTVMPLFLSLIYFERRQFYQIIENQKKRIGDLEQKLNRDKQDIDKSAEA